MAAITVIAAAPLRADLPAGEEVTCAVADTDEETAATIPDRVHYAVLHGSASFRVMMGATTAGGFGWKMESGTIPIIRGGDQKLHFQSETAGCKIWVGWGMD